MSLPVVLRQEAEDDLRNAQEWHESQQEGLGFVFATRALAMLENIGESPNLYGIVWEDVRAAKIRRHPYIIYYRVLSDRVETLAIVHGSRDPSVWKERL